MEKILISACLVGDNTRFDGGNCRNELVSELNQYYDLVPFCPEMEGGLPVPREPGEIFHDAVKTKKGKDITRFYNSGAEKALALCSFLGIKIAVLKENSPSCGVHHIYNGHFNSTTIVGSGITTSLLKSKGIRVISEEELPTFLEDCKEKAGKTALKIELEKQADLGKPVPSRPFDQNSDRAHFKEKGFGKDKSFDGEADHSEKGERQAYHHEDGEGRSYRDSGERRSFRHNDGERRPFRRNEGERSDFRKDNPHSFQTDNPEGEEKRSFRKPRREFDRKSDSYGKRDGRKPYSDSHRSYRPRRDDDNYEGKEKKSYGDFKKDGERRKSFGKRKPYESGERRQTRSFRSDKPRTPRKDWKKKDE